MVKPVLLMIDDDPLFIEGYTTILGDEYQIIGASNLKQGLESIEKHRPAAILLDITLKSEKEGLDILPLLKQKYPWIPVIIITNWDSHLIYKEALNSGADDFFVKSDQVTNLKNIINLHLNQKKFNDQNKNNFPIACSPTFRQVLKEARNVARTNCIVLITGETGVGKEVVAEYIHKHSRRKDKPFIAINCGAIPHTLIESEFFGFEKGAFTGAIRTKLGKFETANGGTIFLDEIEELDFHAQSTLLRAIQNLEIEHIGGTHKISIDTRFIVATQHNLETMVKEGKFREDLYYRLSVYPLYIPPLREREEDIIPLSQYYLNFFTQKYHISKKKFTQAALLMLKNYHWPGNVRELKNVIERALIHGTGTEIRPADFLLSIGEDISPDIPYDYAKKIAVKNFQKKYIKAALIRNRGNISRTAEEIGISRQALQKLLKNLQMDV